MVVAIKVCAVRSPQQYRQLNLVNVSSGSDFDSPSPGIRMAVSNVTAQTVHGDPSSDVDYDLLVAKMLALIVLGHGPFLLGVVPFKLTTSGWWTTGPFSPPSSGGHRPRDERRPHARPAGRRAASQLLRFGGGALMCTALLRLQPDVRDRVAALQRAGRLPDTERLGDALFCLGFFALFLVDELAHAALPRRPGNAGEDVLRRSLSLRQRSAFASDARGRQERRRPTESEGVQSRTADGAEDRSLLRGLFTVLALSCHEVAEGMAIGLAARADHAWCLLAAVATRKLVVACCVGLELAWSDTRRSVLIVYAVTSAAVAPVGIVAGMLIAHHFGGPVAVVLRGLTAGTLLYVVFSEVLPPHESGRSHLLPVVVGFGVLLLL